MKVHNSQAYRKMDVIRERIRRISELREIFLSFQTGFNLVNAAAVYAFLESISDLEPSSVITEPRKSIHKIQQAIGLHEDLTIVKRRKLQWYGHVSRSSGLAKTILQGTMYGGRRQGRQRKKWEDNIRNGQAWSSPSPRGQCKTGKWL